MPQIHARSRRSPAKDREVLIVKPIQITAYLKDAGDLVKIFRPPRTSKHTRFILDLTDISLIREQAARSVFDFYLTTNVGGRKGVIVAPHARVRSIIVKTNKAEPRMFDSVDEALASFDEH